MARIICTGLLLLCFNVSSPGQNSYGGGIVYGPKAAFNINAPQGWVLDNESGTGQGLPCVLYPKGQTWADAKTVIYAKVASTQYEDVNEFVTMAIKEMAASKGKPKEKILSGKTYSGNAWFINEYSVTKENSQWERVAYVQLPHAVAYVVLSSRDKKNYDKDKGALEEVLKTVIYLEPKKEESKQTPTPGAL